MIILTTVTCCHITYNQPKCFTIVKSSTTTSYVSLVSQQQCHRVTGHTRLLEGTQKQLTVNCFFRHLSSSSPPGDSCVKLGETGPRHATCNYTMAFWHEQHMLPWVSHHSFSHTKDSRSMWVQVMLTRAVSDNQVLTATCLKLEQQQLQMCPETTGDWQAMFPRWQRQAQWQFGTSRHQLSICWHLWRRLTTSCYR